MIHPDNQRKILSEDPEDFFLERIFQKKFQGFFKIFADLDQG